MPVKVGRRPHAQPVAHRVALDVDLGVEAGDDVEVDELGGGSVVLLDQEVGLLGRRTQAGGKARKAEGEEKKKCTKERDVSGSCKMNICIFCILLNQILACLETEKAEA